MERSVSSFVPTTSPTGVAGVKSMLVQASPRQCMVSVPSHTTAATSFAAATGLAGPRRALTPPRALTPSSVAMAPATVAAGGGSVRMSSVPSGGFRPIPPATMPAGASMSPAWAASPVKNAGAAASVVPSFAPALPICYTPVPVARMASTPSFSSSPAAQMPASAPAAALERISAATTPASAMPATVNVAGIEIRQVAQVSGAKSLFNAASFAPAVEGPRIARSLTPKGQTREALRAAPQRIQTLRSPVDNLIQLAQGPSNSAAETAATRTGHPLASTWIAQHQDHGRGPLEEHRWGSSSPSQTRVGSPGPARRVRSSSPSGAQFTMLPDTMPAVPLAEVAPGSPQLSPYAVAVQHPPKSWELAPTIPSTLPTSGIARPSAGGRASRSPSPAGSYSSWLKVQGTGQLGSQPATVLNVPVGTPDFLRSFETLPCGTRTGVMSQYSSPSPSQSMLPLGVASPEAPSTRPASPSHSFQAPNSYYHQGWEQHAPVVPMTVERHLGPLPHPDLGMLPLGENANLAREVAARDVELRVLREEVAARDREASELRDRLQDVGAKLLDANGDVDTMSAKVETMAGNRHAVLKASCAHVSDKVEALQRRLAQSEVELAEKDHEIQVLRQANAEDQHYVQLQREELGDLHLGQQEQDEKARWLAQHRDGLKRKAAIDVWHDGVQAQLEQERADHAAQLQRQVAAEQMEQLSQECASMCSLLCNLERTSQQHVQSIQDTKKKYDDLSMEARLGDSTAKLGQEAAHEQAQSQLAELHGLEARLAEQTARKSRSLSASEAYSQHENAAMRHMTELISLTECMREISRVLHDKESGLSMHKDPTQRAVDEEVMLLHHIEDLHFPSRPHLASPGPVLALPGTRPPMSGPGRSRSASPFPAWREVSPGPMGMPRLPSTPRSRSPMPPGPSMPMPMGPPTGPRSWGMPALTAPITIGGAM